MSEADFTQRISEQLKIEASDKIIVQSVVPEPKLTPVVTIAVGPKCCFQSKSVLFMVALCHRADHIYFHPVSSSSFFFFLA